MCHTGEVKWQGNARANFEKPPARLDADKQYWRILFDFLKERYKWASENDGALLQN
jgi:hypothetical protein